MSRSFRDPTTLSNYHLFRTTDTEVNYAIDFEDRIISGDILLKLQSLSTKSNREIHLDTSHLHIGDVRVDNKRSKWELLPRSEPYGSQLKIFLDDEVEEGRTMEVGVGLWPHRYCRSINDHRSNRLMFEPRNNALL